MLLGTSRMPPPCSVLLDTFQLFNQPRTYTFQQSLVEGARGKQRGEQACSSNRELGFLGGIGHHAHQSRAVSRGTVLQHASLLRGKREKCAPIKQRRNNATEERGIGDRHKEPL